MIIRYITFNNDIVHKFHVNGWTLLSSSPDEQEDILRIHSRKSRAYATQDEVQNVVSADRLAKDRLV